MRYLLFHLVVRFTDGHLFAAFIKLLDPG